MEIASTDLIDLSCNFQMNNVLSVATPLFVVGSPPCHLFGCGVAASPRRRCTVSLRCRRFPPPPLSYLIIVAHGRSVIVVSLRRGHHPQGGAPSSSPLPPRPPSPEPRSADAVHIICHQPRIASSLRPPLASTRERIGERGRKKKAREEEHLGGGEGEGAAAALRSRRSSAAAAAVGNMMRALQTNTCHRNKYAAAADITLPNPAMRGEAEFNL
uniref:Uncharacterized protein n=1 Tax=Oryza rufipogon TaxID=4529 RepID=A0A0E0PHM2_ORYRU